MLVGIAANTLLQSGLIGLSYLGLVKKGRRLHDSAPSSLL